MFINAEDLTLQDDKNETQTYSQSSSLNYTITAEYDEQKTQSKTNERVQTITTEQIESSPALSTTELLEKYGDINVKQYGAYGSDSILYLRNFSGSSVAVLIDGVQVNSAQNGEFDINKINPSYIEKIEILRGAGSFEYSLSGAAGGVINIVTKQSSKNDFSLSLGILNKSYSLNNLHDTQQITFHLIKNINQTNYGLKTFSLGSSFVHADNNYLYKDYNNNSVTQENNRAYSTGVDSSLKFVLPYDMTLDFSNILNLSSVLCPGNIYSSTIGQQKNIFNNSIIKYFIPYAFNGFIDITTLLSYKFDKLNYFEDINITTQESIHNLHTITFSSVWKFFFNNFTLFTASDICWNKLSSTDCHITNQDTQPQRTEAGFCVSLDYSMQNGLQFFPSIKLLYVPDRKDDFFPIPKLEICYKKNEFLFTINLYRMFVLPTLNQLYWDSTINAAGNPLLKNESGWGTDFGFDFNKIISEHSIGFSLGLFASYYENKIQWASENGILKSSNTGSAAYFGGDIEVNYSYNTWLTFSARYDYSLTYLLTSNLTLHDNRRIMYTPVNQFSINTLFNLNKFSCSISYHFTDLRYVSNLNLSWLKPYSLIDASITYKIFKDISLSFCGNNLLNTEYYEVEDYPMPGISFTLGLHYGK